jgi:hypothetical protein
MSERTWLVARLGTLLERARQQGDEVYQATLNYLKEGGIDQTTIREALKQTKTLHEQMCDEAMQALIAEGKVEIKADGKWALTEKGRQDLDQKESGE